MAENLGCLELYYGNVLTGHKKFDLTHILTSCVGFKSQRTSDSGNGYHCVILPMIFENNKICQKLPSSYISSLLVSFLRYSIDFPISMNE